MIQRAIDGRNVAQFAGKANCTRHDFEADSLRWLVEKDENGVSGSFVQGKEIGHGERNGGDTAKQGGSYESVDKASAQVVHRTPTIFTSKAAPSWFKPSEPKTP